MAERISQINAETKNRFHLIPPVPFMVIFSVRLFKGLTSRTKAANPAIKGKSIIRSPVFGSRPNTLKSLGFAESREYTSGFETDFISDAIINGMAPMVFDAIRIMATITTYLQMLFFPVNVDSRWFMGNR